MLNSWPSADPTRRWLGGCKSCGRVVTSKTQDVPDTCEACDLRAENERLMSEIDCLERLLVCYRLNKRPSDALLNKLEKLKEARQS